MKPHEKLLHVYTLVLLSSCASLKAPKPEVDVTVYISDPAQGRFVGSDRKGNKRIVLFTETGGYFCVAPEDAEEVLK